MLEFIVALSIIVVTSIVARMLDTKGKKDAYIMHASILEAEEKVKRSTK